MDESVGPGLIGQVGKKILYYTTLKFPRLCSLILLLKYYGRGSLNLNTASLRFTTIPLAKTKVTAKTLEENFNSNY